MKIHKTISIDEELVEELSKVNASNVINELLTDYFCKNANMQKADIKKKIYENEQERDRLLKANDSLSDDLKAIEDREAKIQAAVKDIPKSVLDDFQAFPDMTETILFQRFKEIHKIAHPELKFSQVQKAWEETQDN